MGLPLPLLALEREIHSSQLLDFIAKKQVWRERLSDGELLSHLEMPSEAAKTAVVSALAGITALEDTPYGVIADRILKALSHAVRIEARYGNKPERENNTDRMTTGA